MKKVKKVKKVTIVNNPLCIVGIGASAGGLEALKDFFSHVPTASNIAFVVIQHLDPTHKDIMHELLQRTTSMKVTQAQNHIKVKPNCVYLIPPNKDLSILNGVLFLLEPVSSRGLRLPINFFFRSLANDQQERAVGVILSGMGSDCLLSPSHAADDVDIVDIVDRRILKNRHAANNNT